ncbi:hypothetical protein J7J13_01210 [bacterium]|nr:hypothetical protein [bacterium]
MKAKNIKISLAIFSALVIASFALFTAAQENSSSNKSIFLDSDQDGLSDKEEKMRGTDPENKDTDGDGYSDGTEVSSGYDPLKPAPGDKIISQEQSDSELEALGAVKGVTDENGETEENQAENKNLTEEVSYKVAELVSGTDAENQKITLENIESLIQESMEGEITFEDLPEINEDEIKIKEQDYSSLSKEKREDKEKEDAVEYLTSVSYLILNSLPHQVNSIDDLEKFSEEILEQVSLFSSSLSDISYFKDLADRGEDALEQLKDIEVPENLLELHTRGLQITKYAISLCDESDFDSQDPIATITNLSKVNGLVILGTDFLEEIDTELKEMGISEIPIDL